MLIIESLMRCIINEFCSGWALTEETSKGIKHTRCSRSLGAFADCCQAVEAGPPAAVLTASSADRDSGIMGQEEPSRPPGGAAERSAPGLNHFNGVCPDGRRSRSWELNHFKPALPASTSLPNVYKAEVNLIRRLVLLRLPDKHSHRPAGGPAPH